MNERLPTRLFATDRYSGRRLNCYPSIEEPEVEITVQQAVGEIVEPVVKGAAGRPVDDGYEHQRDQQELRLAGDEVRKPFARNRHGRVNEARHRCEQRHPGVGEAIHEIMPRGCRGQPQPAVWGADDMIHHHQSAGEPA